VPWLCADTQQPGNQIVLGFAPPGCDLRSARGLSAIAVGVLERTHFHSDDGRTEAAGFSNRAQDQRAARGFLDVDRSRILALMQQVMEKQGVQTPLTESASMQEVRFRSLDFSEVALRIEQEIGRELNFEAASLRQIRTVGDVLDFLQQAAR
jgi:acyl carrier protein